MTLGYTLLLTAFIISHLQIREMKRLQKKLIESKQELLKELLHKIDEVDRLQSEIEVLKSKIENYEEEQKIIENK